MMNNRLQSTVAAIIAAIILGGATLSAGLGAGIFFGRLYADSKAVLNDWPAFSSTNVSALPNPVEFNPFQYTSVVNKVSDAVVSINIIAEYTSHINEGQTRDSSGSGFVFAMDEKSVYIATNNHVISGSSMYSIISIIIMFDGEQPVVGRPIGGDSQADLAVIAVNRSALDALGIPYTVVTLGDSSELLVGDEVVAIGNMMGEGKTATKGIISAVGKSIFVDSRTLDVLQTDAAINPGNSGGPLVNMRGEVIGINTAKTSRYGIEGMGYSIPSNIARDILYALLEDGTVPKPSLGIGKFTEIDNGMKNLFSFPSMGLLVRSLDKDGPAEMAGVLQNDIIVGFNGHPIETLSDLSGVLGNAKIGDEALLRIVRNNATIEVFITIVDANLE